jgi:hypothetical protein
LAGDFKIFANETLLAVPLIIPRFIGNWLLSFQSACSAFDFSSSLSSVFILSIDIDSFGFISVVWAKIAVVIANVNIKILKIVFIKINSLRLIIATNVSLFQNKKRNLERLR